MPQVARELGVSPQTLTNSIAPERIDAGELPGLTSDERARLRELERENRILREEREILRKAAGFLAGDDEARRVEVTHRFIDVERRSHRIATMCRVLRVSRSGFYAWQARGAPSARPAILSWPRGSPPSTPSPTAPTAPRACTPSCAQTASASAVAASLA